MQIISFLWYNDYLSICYIVYTHIRFPFVPVPFCFFSFYNILKEWYCMQEWVPKVHYCCVRVNIRFGCVAQNLAWGLVSRNLVRSKLIRESKLSLSLWDILRFMTPSDGCGKAFTSLSIKCSFLLLLKDRLSTNKYSKKKGYASRKLQLCFMSRW